MAANSRFAVGVHCLLSLSLMGDEGATAEGLAASVQTHPVVLRRLLKALEKHDLVEIRPGKGGGVRLRRAPELVSLDQVLDAVEPEGEIFAHHEAPPHPFCQVSCSMKDLLQPVFQRVDSAIHDTLAGVTIADLAQQLRCAQERKSP